MKRKLSLLVLAAALAGAGTVNYSYNAAGRLEKAVYSDGTTITYVYDKAGNLLKREVVGAGTSSAAPAKESTPKTASKRRSK